jgi:hypothetical protein
VVKLKLETMVSKDQRMGGVIFAFVIIVALEFALLAIFPGEISKFWECPLMVIPLG